MRETIVVLLLGFLIVLWLGTRHPPDPEPRADFSVAGLLSADADGFERIEGPAPVVFPEDYAAHPDYRHEWWYFTGNLEGPAGGRYGFQFTLFRFGIGGSGLGTRNGIPTSLLSLRENCELSIACARDSGLAGSSAGENFDTLDDSGWSADQVWMAHVAVSDVEGERFLSRQRFARGALDLAGATADHWWLKDWNVAVTDDGWRLKASSDEFALDLQLESIRPHVLQGDSGYSRKGPEAGNASRYLSWTRLRTSGTLNLDGRSLPVEGLAWLDREWGSGALPEDLAGWDWFALHLADGRDLMYYRLRRHDGNASEFSAGVLVGVDGEVVRLDAGDIVAHPHRWWRDKAGFQWPVAWDLSIPGRGMNFRVEAVFDAQLWDNGFRYWEGAVDVFEGGTEAGRGYLELTGYKSQGE